MPNTARSFAQNGAQVMDLCTCPLWMGEPECPHVAGPAQQRAVDGGDQREPGVEVGPEDRHVSHGGAHLLRKHGAPPLRQVLVHADDVQAIVCQRRREPRHLRPDALYEDPRQSAQVPFW